MVQAVGRHGKLVIFEFRKLAGTAHRIGINQIRRVNLGVAMLLRMHIEHELRQRAMQPRQSAFHDDKTRTGNFGRGLEVKQPETFTDVDMIFGCKIKLSRIADTPHFDVGIRITSCRHAVVRHIGHMHQEVADPLLHIFELAFKGFQLFSLRIDFSHQRRGILFFRLQLADLLRQRIAPRLQILRFGLNRLAFIFQRGELRHVERVAAISLPRCNRRAVCPQ